MLDDLPETIFLCIASQEYGGEMNMTMTETMYQAFPKMAELLFKELSRWQITPVESAAIRQTG